MKDDSVLNNIDSSDADNIRQIAKNIVSAVDPLSVILFGSFAKGTHREDSDYDFYVVIPNDGSVNDASFKAYRSAVQIQRRPVDIVVGTKNRFDRYGHSPDSLYIEGEVMRSGAVLYDAGRERTAV